ncbi:hypothetical protein DMENIID0001_098370 [Sergentomyia squamirostris]
MMMTMKFVALGGGGEGVDANGAAICDCAPAKIMTTTMMMKNLWKVSKLVTLGTTWGEKHSLMPSQWVGIACGGDAEMGEGLEPLHTDDRWCLFWSQPQIPSCCSLLLETDTTTWIALWHTERHAAQDTLTYRANL